MCSTRTKTATCDKCKDEFCKVHGEMGKTRECCGMTLCGFTEDDEGFEGCKEEHQIKKLKCGHEGCNYYTKKGCRACGLEKNDKKEETAMLQDKKLVEALLKKSKSKTLKTSLSAWLKMLPKDSSPKKNVKKHIITQVTAAGASKKHKSENQKVVSQYEISK
jgi:hypothetical protein